MFNNPPHPPNKEPALWGVWHARKTEEPTQSTTRCVRVFGINIRLLSLEEMPLCLANFVAAKLWEKCLALKGWSLGLGASLCNTAIKLVCQISKMGWGR